MWPEPQLASLSFSFFSVRRAIEATREAVDTQRDRNPAVLSMALGQGKSWEGLTCLLTTLTGRQGGKRSSSAAGCLWVPISHSLALGVPPLQAGAGNRLLGSLL